MRINRPYFLPLDKPPYFEQQNILVDQVASGNPQDQVAAFHQAIKNEHPDTNILECSGASALQLGKQLSAFDLQITTSHGRFSIECLYQSCKVFDNGGPYIDLLHKTSREAKTDFRLRRRNKLIGFNLFTTAYTLEDVGEHFYNWIFCIALHQNNDKFQRGTFYDTVKEFNVFTDLYVKAKPHACQARAVAIALALRQTSKWDFQRIANIAYYIETVTT